MLNITSQNLSIETPLSMRIGLMSSKGLRKKSKNKDDRNT